jgi:hypothetical protein
VPVAWPIEDPCSLSRPLGFAAGLPQQLAHARGDGLVALLGGVLADERGA